jgi:hypothetical protein
LARKAQDEAERPVRRFGKTLEKSGGLTPRK